MVHRTTSNKRQFLGLKPQLSGHLDLLSLGVSGTDLCLPAEYVIQGANVCSLASKLESLKIFTYLGVSREQLTVAYWKHREISNVSHY
ncbi:hypothetical protein BaRGS_00037648 [Batillaria attramentaria]|uniref:Uncharacterized protein n=1 Tax=Batillaria attramentaria TaxID=370345 RepID=A0ABD0J865_9CAEN